LRPQSGLGTATLHHCWRLGDGDHRTAAVMVSENLNKIILQMHGKTI
jgi:hypothetical protein